MIDWSTVFEAAKPEKGATEAQVAEFVATFGLGLPAERPIPPSYLSFVRYSNGGDFQNGDRLFQMYGTGLRAMMFDRNVHVYMPLAVPFAFNGGGVMYMFDMREPPGAHGEYPIICAAAGNLTFDPNDSPKVANTFEEACRARFRVERLRRGGIVLTAEQWDVWTDPKPMLDDCKDDRKLRLFACAWVRRVWHALPDGPFRGAVELAERLADEGLALDAERSEARAACAVALEPIHPHAAALSALNCLDRDARSAARNVTFSAARATAEMIGDDPPDDPARAQQADLLREIFGNPLRSVRLESAWIAWNSRTVPQIAARIYDTGAFGDLPVLADALEDAGCTNAELLTHLRSASEHVRGCWALDLLRDEPP